MRRKMFIRKGLELRSLTQQKLKLWPLILVDEVQMKLNLLEKTNS